MSGTLPETQIRNFKQINGERSEENFLLRDPRNIST